MARIIDYSTKIKTTSGDYFLVDNKSSGTKKVPADDIVMKSDVDSVPTQGSSNAVSSGGVYEALQSTGLSENAKTALLACFEHVAWVDEHGQDYYDALYDALYSGAEYPQLSVSYNPPEYFTLYIGEGLDILKNFLTVTLHTSESESAVVNDYDLTGSIDGASNTITVSYDGLTDTFVATAEQWSLDLSLIIGNFQLPGTTVRYDGTQTARATFNTVIKRLPVGTYTINCTNSNYLYGAQFIRTASPKLFETSARVQTEGTSATLWTGTMSKNWEISGFPKDPKTGSSTFTITDPEGFWTINFKKSNNANMTASDKQAIQAAFTMTRTV